jgi:archaellum biogenesis ATPase FlaH
LVEYSDQNFYWYSIKISCLFQRENKEELMGTNRLETKKTGANRMEPELKLINMETVEVEQIEWMLYPFIPYGKVTIIQGDPGEGKTTMVLQVIAKLTKGETIIPDLETEKKANAEISAETNLDTMESQREPVNVIYQTAEDGLGDTIKPRLLEAGADCSRVLVIDDREQPLTMLDVRLEEAIVQTKARLVVLDPIQGFLGSEVDMHRANEIRPLMKRVAVLAEKYHCAIILIGHMNKNSNGKSSYRGLGSIDFQAAARSVLIVGRIKDEPEIRVVCHVKSSLAPEGKSIAFRLDKETGFEWIGEYDISADDLLSGDTRGQKSRKAKEFLLEILEDGGTAQKTIEAEAEKQGIRKKTLRNAKKELGIDAVKRGNQWFWMMSE